MKKHLYHFKLINGEEIISEIGTSSNEAEYFLKNPMIIQEVVDQQTSITAIILSDYVPFNDAKNIVLSKASVVSSCRVSEGMAKYYNVSVDFNIYFTTKEVQAKLTKASVTLENYIQTKLKEAFQLPTESKATEDDFDEYFQEIDEEDMDEDLLDELTSANTTIH